MLELNQEVYVIDSTLNASPPCVMCDHVSLDRKREVIQTVISEILSTVSNSAPTRTQYRVRVDQTIQTETWGLRDEDSIFLTREEAEIELAKRLLVGKGKQ